MNTPTSNESTALGALLRQNFPTALPAEEAKPQKKVYRYPYLDKEGINQTIQNGKRFADAYNKEQEEKSSWIHRMNYDLRKATKEKPHTSEQKVLFLEFKKEHKLASAVPMAYNQKVLEFNRKHGTHFLLRTYRTLRNEVAVTFAHLVFYYAAQIRDTNARKMNAGVTTAGTLPRMLTNSESLKRYKVEGVPQCPYQNDAILAHVHHLVEAGLLINYKSHGRNMGFSVDFNPEILAVQDYNSSKIQKAVNQSVIKFKKGKPTYSDCNTRTPEDKNEIKGDAVASPGERNDAAASTSATRDTTRTTKSEATPAPPASSEQGNSVKNPADRPKKQEQNSPAAENSAFLEARIRDKWELCTELAADLHVNHVPVDKNLLLEEARTGTMSQAAFRDLLFQEFMKYISRLKKGNQSGAGAFYRAFEELEDKKLITAFGRYFTKDVMLEKFMIWLKCVDYAEKNWGQKRNWQFLYINAYLDTTRRDAKEMGFWYVVEKIYVQEEKKKAKRKAERAKRAAEAQKRKKKIKADRVEKHGYGSVKPGTNARSLTDFEKARKQVRNYLYGKIPFEELHRYCRHNLSKTIVDGLQNLIQSETENLRKYNA